MGRPSGRWLAVALTTLESGERTHRWPHVLPGSEAVLFTSHTSVAGFDDARIEAVHVKTRRRKTIRRGGSGQLLYARKGTLFAEPFDAAEDAGAPMPSRLTFLLNFAARPRSSR